MDFRISQQHGTAFCYVLPYSERQALVEYTLFTPSLLHQEQYDQGLKVYVEEILKVKNYRVSDTEFGIIPMTNHHFPTHQKKIINIGTAGGQTKGSSGYTFYFIQKHSKKIVETLMQTGSPIIPKPSPRFHFYDSVLLHILQHRMHGLCGLDQYLTYRFLSSGTTTHLLHQLKGSFIYTEIGKM